MSNRRQVRPPIPIDRKVNIEARRLKVMDLVVGGMPVASIAEHLSVSRKVVYDDINAKLTSMAESAPSTALYRQKHLHRITYLINVWWERAHDDLGALDRIIKLMAREARLLGLDAPQTHMVHADVNVQHGSNNERVITLDMTDPEAAREYERLRESAIEVKG